MVVRRAYDRATWAALLGFVLLSSLAPAAGAELRWTYRGCVAAASAPAHDCSPTAPIARVTGMAFSPDGSSLVVAGTRSSGVMLFSRDVSTGSLAGLSCISNDATDGRDGTDGACADGDALVGPTALASDGTRYYVTATRSGAVDVLGAGPALSSLQCLKASGVDSHCREEPALAGARALALAPGGSQVYVAAAAANAIVTLQRDASSGLLTPAGCVAANGLDGHCRDGAGLLAPSAIVAAPAGGAVYAIASGSQGIVSLARDRSTGELRQTGCILARVPRGGTCRHAHALAGAYALALSPDGRDLYVAARYADALTLLRTDPVTATLHVAGCLGRPTQVHSCSPDGALGGVRAVAVSSDGRAAVAATGDGLELFSRDAATGVLHRAACVRARPRARTQCQVVGAVADARSLAISPDARDVYVGTEDGIAAFRIEATR